MRQSTLRSSSRFGPAKADVPSRTGPSWMFYCLAIASLVNLAIGAMILFAPSLTLGWLGVPASANVVLTLWQAIGGLWIALAIGSWIAAGDPLGHWPVVMVALLSKIGVTLGVVLSCATGGLPWTFAIVIAVAAAAWILPYFTIVRAAWAEDEPLPAIRKFYPFMKETILQTAMTHGGERLLDLSERQPLLVVFLRHAGCTFCREAQSELATQRAAIEASGARIVLIHMGTPETAEQNAASFGLRDIDMVSDPERALYWAFGLRRGGFGQLFGPKVLWRGFVAGVFRRLGIGSLDGDGYQMPGAFLFWRGRVGRHYYHRSAADRPDYVELAKPLEVVGPSSTEAKAVGE